VAHSGNGCWFISGSFWEWLLVYKWLILEMVVGFKVAHSGNGCWFISGSFWKWLLVYKWLILEMVVGL